MNTRVVSESELWIRAQENDGRAFAALFDLHRDRVFRHSLRLLESSFDAEEVAAAAFFELWRHRDSVILTNDSVLPWLLVTAGNLARDSRRALRRYRELFDSLAHTPEPEPEEARDAADAAALRTALKGLPATDASLIALVVLEGFPIVEAATILGLKPGAARTRLHRAKARLRGRLVDGNSNRGDQHDGEN